MTLAALEGLSFGIILDGALVFLLLVTIGFAFRLDRKLSALRAAQSEMERLSGSLTRATREAEEGLQGLQASAGKLGEQLGRDTQAAGATVEELRFLTEKAQDALSRLEGGVISARERSPLPRPAAARRPAPRPDLREAPAAAPVSDGIDFEESES